MSAAEAKKKGKRLASEKAVSKEDVPEKAVPDKAVPDKLPDVYNPQGAEAGGSGLVYGGLVHMQTQRSGPLPPADEMIKYERALPGSANRIIAMAEKEQNHEHEVQLSLIKTHEILEKEEQRIESRNSLLGMVFGLLIGLGTLTACVYMAGIGQTIPSALIGTGGIGSLVAVFVTGRWAKKKKENESKDEDS